MTVSRKSTDDAGESEAVIVKNHAYDLTQECYDESKMELQKRSGYDPVPLSEIGNKAVEEKLPSGSQSY